MANPVDKYLSPIDYSKDTTQPVEPIQQPTTDYRWGNIDDYLGTPDTWSAGPSERSWGTLISDQLTKFGSASINAVGSVAALGSLSPGTNRMADPISQGLAGVAEDFSEWGLSDHQKNLDQGMAQAIADSVTQLGEDASVMDHLDNIKNQGGAMGQFIMDNPAQALSLITESLPYLIGGAGIARGLGAVTKLGAPTRAAIGEGTMAAGASTQQIVGDLQDQGITDWTAERLYGGLAGLGTLGIGRLGAKLQGPVDIDTLLAGKAGNLGKAPNAAVGAVKGAGFEGAEELLQGAQEEAFGNLATGRPISENVGSSAIAGSIAGGTLGGMSGTLAGLARSSATQNQSPFVPSPMPSDPSPQQPPIEGGQPVMPGSNRPAPVDGNGFDDVGAVAGSVSPYLNPEMQSPPPPVVDPQIPESIPTNSPIETNVSYTPEPGGTVPQPGMIFPQGVTPYDKPLTGGYNTPQNVPGSPVSNVTPQPIPTPTPASAPTTGSTGAVPKDGAPEAKRPVLLKPRAPAKTKVRKKPKIVTQPRVPTKKKPIESYLPDETPETPAKGAVKKRPGRKPSKTRKKLPPQTSSPIPVPKPTKSKPVKGETEIEKLVRELDDIVKEAKYAKSRFGGELVVYYLNEVKKKKKEIAEREFFEKSEPKRKKGTGKGRWKKTGRVKLVSGTESEYKQSVEAIELERKDGKPSPKISLVKQGPKGGRVSFSKKDNEALDAVLNAIHSWENLGDTIKIEIYKKHGGAVKKPGNGINPGAMWRSSVTGKSLRMVIILEELIEWSEKYDDGNLVFTAEQTVAHEIGVHGIQRMTGDAPGFGLIDQNQAFWEKVYEENQEAIDEFINEGDGGGYFLKPKRTQAEEYFAFLLQEELADIAAGRRQTYSAALKRYLRQVAAYLDSLYGMKYTQDQVAEMLVDAAERGMKGDKPLNEQQLWSTAKDGVFHWDDTVEWKSREPESPGAIESFARIDVGSVKPGWPTTERELKYYSSRWNGTFLKGVKDWGWKGTTAALIEEGKLDGKELKERFGKNVHSTFSYLNQQLSGVQGMDIEVVYERPDSVSQRNQGIGRATVYAKIRRKSDPSVYFNIRVSDHVPDMGEKVRIDAPITIDFANGPFVDFDQTWKDRIDLGLKILRDDNLYKTSALQAAIEKDINDGFMVKPLSDTETTDKGYAKNAKSTELKTLTEGKGQLVMERPGVELPLDIKAHQSKSRYKLGEFTYQEFLDGYAVPTETLQSVYFADVQRGVRKVVKLPDPVASDFVSQDTTEVSDKQTDTPQSERTVSTKEYAKDWGSPTGKGWKLLSDKTFWRNLVTGKGDVIPAHSREKAKQQLFAWNDSLVLKSKGKIDLTSLSITGLGGLKEFDSYLKGRYTMMGGYQKVEKLAKDIYKTFSEYSKINPDYNTAIFDYLTGKYADPAMSVKEQREASERVLRQLVKEEAVVKLAIKLKKRINSNAKEAVELGLLKSDHPTDGDQNYLPRLYLKHILETEDYKILSGGGGKISNRSYAKKRKDLEEATRAYLGEVKDAAFLGASTIAQVGRDIHTARFLQDISAQSWATDNNWVMPGSVVNIAMFRGGLNNESSAEDTQRIDVREVSAGTGKTVSVQWLLDEADRIRVRSAQTKDKAAKKMAEDLADQLEALYKKKNGKLMSSEQYRDHKNQYRQVPISSRYGALSGMYVNKRIYNDLFNNGPAFDNKYWRAAEVYHAGWKMLKVPLNIPTVARNVMSNFGLQMLAGIPPTSVFQYDFKVAGDLINWKMGKKPPTEAIKVAEKYGIEASGFASREITALFQEFERKVKKDPTLKENPLALMWHFAKAGTKHATNFYGQIEVWMKIAVIQYHLDQGADGWTAFKEAQDALFDYSLLNSGAKKFRRSPIGAPFLSFSMLAARRLGQVITTNPMRLMWFYAISQLFWYATAAVEDVDQEDLEDLHKALPGYLSDKPDFFLLPIPGRDSEGRMRFYDFSYTHPFGGLLEMAKNTSKGEVTKVMEMMGFGGAPLLQMMMAFYNNKDPFTKKDITNKEFTTKEKMWDYSKFVWRHNLPSLITEQGAIYKMWQASEFEIPLLGYEKKKQVGSSVLNWGETKSTVPQAALRLGGINVYSVDPGKTASKNLMILSYRMRDLDAGYKRKVREAKANGNPEEVERITEVWRGQKAQLAQEMDEMRKLRKINPNLKIKDIKN